MTIFYTIEFTEWGESLSFQHVDGQNREVSAYEMEGWVLRLESGTLSGHLLDWAKGNKWNSYECQAQIVLSHPEQGEIVSCDVGNITPLFHSGLRGSTVDELYVHADGVPAGFHSIKKNSEYFVGNTAQPYEWASWPFFEKLAWSRFIRVRTKCYAPATTTEFILEGKHVIDVPSAFLAIGEAIVGSRGYYGGGLDALSDCMCGGFGPVPPFVLRWKDSEISRKHLDSVAWRRALIAEGICDLRGLQEPRDGDEALWKNILEVLREAGVTVLCE